ncbi:MAG TPA: T9SS type A sorting domain-containing protein, partial [Flavisolibacter sp.]|nr:T9SS type A sorting domain-containing protein [Flavisolibacter sp.]
VFKISLETKLASYVGSIKGLPRGFSTNGAIAEGDSKVIVSSSGSTEGYYRFDLNTLQAEKLTEGGTVFNASDLANGTLAFEKKNKEEEAPKEAVPVAEARQTLPTVQEAVVSNGLSVYPNPVREGFFKVSFAGQKQGRYNIQLLDGAGRVVSAQQANIGGKVQVEEFRLPRQVSAGNYLVRVSSEDGSYTNTSKLVVQ